MIGALASAGMSAIGGIIQGISAGKAARKARARSKKLSNSYR